MGCDDSDGVQGDGTRARLISVEAGAAVALREYLPADGCNTVVLLQQADESSETLLGRVQRHAANLRRSNVHLTRAAMVFRPRGKGAPWDLRARLAEELARSLAPASASELSFIACGEILAPFRERLFSIADALIARCDKSLTILIHFEAVVAPAGCSGLRPAIASVSNATQLSLAVEAG
jgi:hypothetical protein